MPKVVKKPGESIGSILKRFGKKCKKTGRLRRMDKIQTYIKPSEERRLEEKERLKTIHRSQNKMGDIAGG